MLQHYVKGVTHGTEENEGFGNQTPHSHEHDGLD
jgi:hypothetical protein